MRNIVLATLGSLGDLHPYLAIGKVLANHGDNVTIVTHSHYREIVEKAGFMFIPMRPGPEDVGPEELWIKQANATFRGTEYVIRKLILPHLDDNYRVLMEATVGCDLIISHTLTFAAPIVAQKRGIQWVSIVLQPSAFFSAFDPPTIGSLNFIFNNRLFGPSITRFIFRIADFITKKWFISVYELHTEAGLPLTNKNPLISNFSPYKTLALFPQFLAGSQPDWPDNVSQVGFPLFGDEETPDLSGSLLGFISNGSAPIVFTLGSAIVQMESNFFVVAFQAVIRRGVRAVFLVGDKAQNVPPEAFENPDIFISGYEPFSALFPLCSVIVHQCGIGTTAQAISAGKPQILVPFAHDQPDNARRIKKLRIGVVIPARSLTVSNLSSAIKKVTENGLFLIKARSFSRRLKMDNFSGNIIKALETFGKNNNHSQPENHDVAV